MPVPALELHLQDVQPPGSAVPLWDLVLVTLDEHQVAGIEERDPYTWRVYFGSVQARDAAQHALKARHAESGLSVLALEVPDEDWARRAQADLRAIRIGRLVVAPPWDPPPATSETVVVVIEPSVGFGTGHHASTRLCLALLQQVDVAGRTVLDAGTGSGVLAIAAARLGASRVYAVDTDPAAVRAAAENVRINRVEDVVACRLTDVRVDALPTVDLVLANLTAPLLAKHGAPLAGAVVSGGVLIASGFEIQDEAEVERALAPTGRLHARAVEDGWVGQLWRIR